MMRIDIARDFSRYPVGRDYEDGPDNGLRFRTEILVPKLKQGSVLTITFDGVRMCNPSFLEEAFGGLVRVEKFSRNELKRLLAFDVKSEASNTYKKKALRFIDEAHSKL